MASREQSIALLEVLGITERSICTAVKEVRFTARRQNRRLSGAEGMKQVKQKILEKLPCLPEDAQKIVESVINSAVQSTATRLF